MSNNDPEKERLESNKARGTEVLEKQVLSASLVANLLYYNKGQSNPFIK